MRYEEAINEKTGETFSIRRFNDDGSISSIPLNEANRDYQEYLDRDKPKAALSTPSLTTNEGE